MFNRDSHIKIPGWVILELQLTGNEAICYSIIYGFSQDSESEFYGSLSYLATAMGMKKPNVKRVLDRLLEKGLIRKREEKINGVKSCKYSVINLTTLLSKREGGCYQNDNGGVIKMITNNIDDNIKDNIKEIDTIVSKEKTTKSYSQVAQLPLPYNSQRFVETWGKLLEQAKWRKKTAYALELSLKKLAKMTEQEAIEAMENSIENGWQGIFPRKIKPQPVQAETAVKRIDINQLLQ